MQSELLARLTKTRDGRPLAVLVDFPAQGAELRPHQLRALASALMQIAKDSEELDVAAKFFTPQERVYGLDSLSMAERRVRTTPGSRHEIEIENYVHNGHKVTVYQNACLENGKPTFFVTVGHAAVNAPVAYSIEEARVIGNAKADKRKPGKYSD